MSKYERANIAKPVKSYRPNLPKHFWIRFLTGCLLISEATKTVFKKGDFRLKVESIHACVQCRRGKMFKGCRKFFYYCQQKLKVTDNFSNINENKNCLQTFSVSVTMSPCRGVSAMGDTCKVLSLWTRLLMLNRMQNDLSEQCCNHSTSLHMLMYLMVNEDQNSQTETKLSLLYFLKMECESLVGKVGRRQ